MFLVRFDLFNFDSDWKANRAVVPLFPLDPRSKQFTGKLGFVYAVAGNELIKRILQVRFALRPANDKLIFVHPLMLAKFPHDDDKIACLIIGYKQNFTPDSEKADACNVGSFKFEP